MQFNRCLVFCLIALPGLSLRAQSDIQVLLLERGSQFGQTSSESIAPLSQLDSDESDWFFFAGAVLGGRSVDDLRISGGTSPEGENLWIADEDPLEYELDVGIDTLAELNAGAPPGTYTFSGNLEGFGPFTENIQLPAFNPLSPKRITNLDALQNLDPRQPFTLTWEPFTDLGGKEGLILVSIAQWENNQEHIYYESSDTPGYFGLNPALTSLEIPANVLTGNPDIPYTVSLYFARIESLVDQTSIDEVFKGVLSSTETLAFIYAAPSSVLVVNDWVQLDDLGWVYGVSADWGYSLDLGYVWMVYYPGALYQSNLGWMIPVSGTMKQGFWFFTWPDNWFYTQEGLRGWYSDLGDNWSNMINPGG